MPPRAELAACSLVIALSGREDELVRFRCPWTRRDDTRKNARVLSSNPGGSRMMVIDRGGRLRLFSPGRLVQSIDWLSHGLCSELAEHAVDPRTHVLCSLD